MLAAGGAYAAIPNAGGVFHACIKKNGDLRVVDHDAGEDCRPNWEQSEEGRKALRRKNQQVHEAITRNDTRGAWWG